MSLILDYIIKKETKAGLYLKGISEQKSLLDNCSNYHQKMI